MAGRSQRRRRGGGAHPLVIGALLAAILHGGLLAEDEYWGRLDLFGLNGRHQPAAKAPESEVVVDWVPDMDTVPDDPLEQAAAEQAAQRVRAELAQAGIPEAPMPEMTAPLPSPSPSASAAPEAETQPEPPQQMANMKAVQLPEDTPDEDTAPADAEYLSDKNSNPEEQTRATDTNLKRESKGAEPPSAENPEAKPDDPVGGPDDQIAGTQEITTEDLMMKGDGEQETRNPAETPEEAASATPQGQDDGDSKRVGEIAMGDTTQGSVPEAPGGVEPLPGSGGDGGKGARGSKKGVKGLKLQIGDKTYDKIYGAVADRERKVGPQKPSFKRGRFGNKWAMYKQSIENFIPEVKPGNQTALKTRAHPFAVYIAQMHNQIHEQWGFGFLIEAGDHREYDDMSLEATLELVVMPDGTLEKAPTIVRGSGKLNFDVAAMDSVMTASPFGAPPKAIRSANGKTYIHWDFHRDARECMTAFVRPYILTTPPDPNEVDATTGEPKPERGLPSPKILARRKEPARATVPVKTGGGDETTDGDPKAAARGADELPDPADPAARKLLDRLVAALSKRDVAALIKLTAPDGLRSRGEAVPDARAALASLVAEQASAAKLVPQRQVATAGGARKMLGGLPPGEGGEPTALYGVVKLGKQFLVVTMKRTEAGEFVVVALNLK